MVVHTLTTYCANKILTCLASIWHALCFILNDYLLSRVRFVFVFFWSQFADSSFVGKFSARISITHSNSSTMVYHTQLILVILLLLIYFPLDQSQIHFICLQSET